MSDNKKAVVLVSGGLDSACLLYKLYRSGYEVSALGVDYGQRHVRELQAAEAVCRQIGVRHRVADLSAINGFIGGSSQTSPDIEVPHGHYAEESMKLTVVPNRNMIMLALAAGWAISMNYSVVAFAAHSGDHTIYPDCRPEFIDALDSAMNLCDWNHIKLVAPFSRLTKAQIVLAGFGYAVPFHLTYSCYEGREKHCGKCGTCVERKEAFAIAGVKDPTEYED